MKMYGERNVEMETTQYTAKRNTLMVYLFADSSGSMEIDGRIKTANQVIDTTVRRLRAITDQTDKVELVFCACSYALAAKQIGMGPTSAKKFVWYEQMLENGTCMGAALDELNKALDYCEGSIYPPIILILSDGNATDDVNAALDRLRGNPLFQQSHKFGISFDSDHAEDLAAVVGDEHLIPIQELEGFYEKLTAAVQSIIKSQETGTAKAPDMQPDEAAGAPEETPKEIPFINHWSENDWL